MEEEFNSPKPKIGAVVQLVELLNISLHAIAKAPS